MRTIYYQDYRIVIRPAPMPGGWGAQVHIWHFEGGTTRMTPLELPAHIAFGTEASVCAYAEKKARQWVEQRSAGSPQPSSTPSLVAEEEEDARAGMPSYSLSTPTRLTGSGPRTDPCTGRLRESREAGRRKKAVS